ncbi:MAG: hypothetical protein KGI41_03515 [Patescibacteria group bacterium]|nr:hypothetical protein [Patescibacteria group bacterium]MDE1966279.1 hypothetical protein [Patescibacteria group bacterium]
MYYLVEASQYIGETAMLVPCTSGPRDEIWLRKVYAGLVEDRRLTTIFRPGKRLSGDPKGFSVGETLRIRIIENPGVDWAGVLGQLVEGFSVPVEVRSVTVRPIGRLVPEDFAGSTPDVCDRESLRYHLGLVYNLPLSAFADDALVTRTTFRYR